MANSLGTVYIIYIKNNHIYSMLTKPLLITHLIPYSMGASSGSF